MKSPFAIEKVRARQVFDSRGMPTIEVEAVSGTLVGTAIAPAGVSKGRFEAHDLRDEEKHFHGFGVQKALKSVNGAINSELKGQSACDQGLIDKALVELDGTPTKTKLGANAMIATSMAVARLGALMQDKPLYAHLTSVLPATHPMKGVSLPMPVFSMVDGGKHAGNELPFQEFLIIPKKAKTVAHALEIGSEIFHSLRDLAVKKYDARASNVGETGGLALPTGDAREVFDLILEAAKENGHEKQISFGLSVSASHFRKKGMYLVDGKGLTHRQLVNYYANLLAQYPISFLEDPFAEDDIEGFQGGMNRFGKECAIMGEDLLVSNPSRIKRVMDLNACNGIDLKPNQVGTLSESMDSIILAKDAKWTTLVSGRAGDTEDAFISDLSVGWELNYLKAGGLTRSERVAKYNRLMAIEEELGKKAVFKH